MDNSAIIGIAATEARRPCAGITSIEDRVKKAMIATKDHYLLTGEVSRLQAALMAAALESPNEDEKDLILESGANLIKLNNALAAAISGVPVDFGEMADQMPKKEFLPLMKWWREVAA